MKLNHIHHVAVICNDYCRSKRFYTEVLGLEIRSEHYRSERVRTDEYTHKPFLFFSDPDGLPIELYEK